MTEVKMGGPQEPAVQTSQSRPSAEPASRMPSRVSRTIQVAGPGLSGTMAVSLKEGETFTPLRGYTVKS